MIFVIIPILLCLVSLACFIPLLIGLMDAYWWMMTEQTMTTFNYSAGRFEGMFMFTLIGFVVFILALDIMARIDFDTKENNNGDKQTINDT